MVTTANNGGGMSKPSSKSEECPDTTETVSATDAGNSFTTRWFSLLSTFGGLVILLLSFRFLRNFSH